MYLLWGGDVHLVENNNRNLKSFFKKQSETEDLIVTILSFDTF